MVWGPDRPQPGPEDAPEQAAIEEKRVQREALEELAQAIAARGLCSVAIFVLESSRPINFIAAEFMVFLEPFARVFMPTEKYRLIVEALHDRENLAWLVDRLEELEEQRAMARRGIEKARGEGDRRAD